MPKLHSFSSSPVEDSEKHSHFFSNSDDDAETASQRSISLSSGPSSPKLHGDLDLSSNHQTPMLSSPPQQPVSTPNLPTDRSTETLLDPRKKASISHTDPEIDSITETVTSGPSSAVASLKFDEDSTRPSSLSSGTSFSVHEDLGKHEVISRSAGETTYPPASQMIPGHHNAEREFASTRRATDIESLASAATSGSSATNGRKTRPESMLLEPPDGPLVLGIALVDFNHIIGPRVEFFEGSVFEDEELIKILPFLALPDGSHVNNEDYCYFHLVPSRPKPTTIFGISCNRQISSSELLSKGEDVTRSMVQKAVVVLATKPVFGAVRDKLGVVTNAFFNQRDFRETVILKDFMSTLETSLRSQLTESELYMGTSLRELVHKFRHRTLILLKALILQKRIMFFGHPVERLCTYQYSLVTLIPCLLQTLEDCGSPPLAARARTLSRPNSLRTSDRKSLLAFVGLPLDIFGKDAFFQPYLPLQQVDIARDTTSWLCGCTNAIVYTQSNYDLLVNIETNAFEFKDSKMDRLVSLTPADRKWIDDIVRDVNESWDNNDPTRPVGMQFKGSDDYLRTKFEEYVSAALATVKYSSFIGKGESKGVLISDGYDPACQQDFGLQWLVAFKATQAFEVWERVTDPMLFDIVEPRHPCIDKPSAVTDIGLQISETFRELKIEQQFTPTREAISNAFISGSTNFFKAVDGIKGRWPGQRSSSRTSVKVTTDGAQGVADTAAGETPTPATPTPATPTPATPTLATPTPAAPTPTTPPVPPAKPATQPSPPRPPSVVAAQVTSDARAALGALGTGIGSFFASRAGRFSLSRNSSSSIVTPSPIPPSKDLPSPPPTEAKADPPDPKSASTPAKDALSPHPSEAEVDPQNSALTGPNGQAVVNSKQVVEAAPGAAV